VNLSFKGKNWRGSRCPPERVKKKVLLHGEEKGNRGESPIHRGGKKKMHRPLEKEEDSRREGGEKKPYAVNLPGGKKRPAWKKGGGGGPIWEDQKGGGGGDTNQIAHHGGFYAKKGTTCMGEGVLPTVGGKADPFAQGDKSKEP